MTNEAIDCNIRNIQKAGIRQDLAEHRNNDLKQYIERILHEKGS